MRSAILAGLLALGFASAAAAQDQPPPQCRQNAAGQVDYAACAAASEPNSPWRRLSLINLGTQAFLTGDYATAIAHYDAAQPTNGDTFYSDATYHAFYAATLHQVGRADDAIVQARRALAVLRNDASLPPAVRESMRSVWVDPEAVYTAILPVLHAANDPDTAEISAAYLAIPARDWVSWANRAGVLEQIGDLDGALRASGEALRLEPAHPAVLNNHCYILFRADRAAEALPYCERAVAGAPDVAAVRHSLAATLAALGRCDAARAELAEARRLDPVSAEYREELACAAR
jgi:tetratricopeptide (TPR) repeat protein